MNQERSWFDSYKKSYIAKINTSSNDYQTQIMGKSERIIEKEKNESLQKEIKRQAIKVLLGQGAGIETPEKTRAVTQQYVNRRNTNTYKTDY